MSMSFDPCKRFRSVSLTLEDRNQEKSLDAMALVERGGGNSTAADDLPVLEWPHA